jgi:hypothetical protein
MKTVFEQTPDCLALTARRDGLRAAYPAYGIMLAFKRTFIENSDYSSTLLTFSFSSLYYKHYDRQLIDDGHK